MDNEDNFIGWIQEEYYDDIYGDLFKNQENGYYNDWMTQNNVAYNQVLKVQNKRSAEKIKKRVLKEKKQIMQKTMDKLYIASN